MFAYRDHTTIILCVHVWPCPMACGIIVPPPGIESKFPALDSLLLGPPRKPPFLEHLKLGVSHLQQPSPAGPHSPPCQDLRDPI